MLSSCTSVIVVDDVIPIADCHAVPISDVWYVFSAEFFHPREAFLRSSKCCFVCFYFSFVLFCAISAILL